MSSSEIRELRPARPDVEDDQKGYMPRPPWRWIVGLGMFLALAFGIYQVQERREEAALRTALMKAHTGELGPLVARYEKLTGKVLEFTQWAGNRGAPERYVDPRLNLDALYKGKGLYLRLKASDAKSVQSIKSASLDMQPDAIGKCLGVAPALAGELFARGTFLEKSWIEQAETANKMKLRVLEEELRQRTKRDLPAVAETLQSEWFLLVLERGDNRRDAPVDAYLWDLKSEKLLLASRTQADGALVAARIVVSGVKPGNYASGAQTGAAQDCSIGSQLRALAGKDSASFASEPPTPREALQAEKKAEAAPAQAAPSPAPASAPATPATPNP